MLHVHGDRHHASTTCDTAADRAMAPLYRRARRLRQHAPSLTPPLAEAYRRRAAELDLQVWLEAAWNPPIDRIGGRCVRGGGQSAPQIVTDRAYVGVVNT